MGIISIAIVITSSEKRGKAKLSQPGNRKWATVIQGIGTQKAIPPFIILTGVTAGCFGCPATNIPSIVVLSV